MVKLQKAVCRAATSGSVGYQSVDSSLFRSKPLQLNDMHGCLLESIHLSRIWSMACTGGTDHYAELELGSDFMDEDDG